MQENSQNLDFSLMDLGYSSLEILIFFIKIEKKFGMNFMAFNPHSGNLKLKNIKYELMKRGYI
ncbi:hypothetical protein C815_01365 [Firmicutes bacterium M10-2]|nr:hypothetical protein C815_01365 [Firmicutes bacterium M10-2]